MPDTRPVATPPSDSARANRMSKHTSILIVGGCGTFGLSTAYHLARAGYSQITCCDRWPFPSRSSAGYDRNKIVRTEYAEPLYAKLAREALEGWLSPPFAPYFHQTGWVFGTTTPPPPASTSPHPQRSESCTHVRFDQAIATSASFGDACGVVELPNPQALTEQFPCFEEIRGFRGIYNPRAGWVEAAHAMRDLGEECQRLGVWFDTGPQGTVTDLVRDQDGKVVGVQVESGELKWADKIVLCCGAYSDTVLDMEGQVTAVAYSIAHIRLTPEEVEKYRSMPVLDVEPKGYTFPPDADGVIKFGGLHGGHPQLIALSDRSHKVSVPRDHAYHPTDTLSSEDQSHIREFIEFCMPDLQHREFESTRMCWDTESFDCHWILGEHPSSPGSLYVATAGSGHTFKNLPNVGKYVVQALEGTLSEEYRELWRWRPDKVESAEQPERVDLSKLTGWQHDKRHKL